MRMIKHKKTKWGSGGEQNKTRKDGILLQLTEGEWGIIKKGNREHYNKGKYSESSSDIKSEYLVGIC